MIVDRDTSIQRPRGRRRRVTPVIFPGIGGVKRFAQMSTEVDNPDSTERDCIDVFFMFCFLFFFTPVVVIERHESSRSLA